MKPHAFPWLGAASILGAILISGCGDLAEDVRLYRTVGALTVGTPEDEVLKRLGPPTETGTEFHLAQVKGYEAQYRAAQKSSSVRYLFWHGGIDTVCAVGLDRDKRVSYLACGGT